MKYTRTRKAYPMYSASSAVFMSELLKVVICVSVLLMVSEPFKLQPLIISKRTLFLCTCIFFFFKPENARGRCSCCFPGGPSQRIRKGRSPCAVLYHSKYTELCGCQQLAAGNISGSLIPRHILWRKYFVELSSYTVKTQANEIAQRASQH